MINLRFGDSLSNKSPLHGHILFFQNIIQRLPMLQFTIQIYRHIFLQAYIMQYIFTLNPFPALHNDCCLHCHLLVFFGNNTANNMDPDQTAPLVAWVQSSIF